jgi:hypothetical protein
VAKWYKEHGRHEIFAKGKNVEMGDFQFAGVLNETDLTRPNRPEMAGPKTAAEESAMMRKLYQDLVLNKKLDTKGGADKPVQIKGLSRNTDKATAATV